MISVRAKRLACGLLMLWALGPAAPVRAQISIGTWVKQPGPSGAGGLTMTVEACCNGGRRLIYRIAGRSDMIMTVESPFDGTDVPVLVGGKPSAETMGIKRLDERHVVAVLKMNGKPYGTSRATLSADGNTLTVETEVTDGVAGQPVGKQTETWLRK